MIPPPPTSFPRAGDRLLFLGDSITHAFRLPEERGISSQMGSGWAMILSAEIQHEFPHLSVEVFNRGVCGNTAADILNRVDSEVIPLRPTHLTLLCGVNDTIGHFLCNRPSPPDSFSLTCRTLLHRLRSALPDTVIVLMEPFLLETGNVTPSWRNDLRARQDILRQLAREQDHPWIPLQEKFDLAAQNSGPSYWLFDGIHPSAAGHWLLRNAWRDTLLPQHTP